MSLFLRLVSGFRGVFVFGCFFRGSCEKFVGSILVGVGFWVKVLGLWDIGAG